MQGAAILIDEAPPAAQDLFGRGSYRIRTPGPAVKAGKMKTAEQRLHESDYVNAGGDWEEMIAAINQ